MRTARATGRNAATMKYDLITAIGTYACGGDKHLQRSSLRLITLIVARYNWQADELTVGQREMAELWSVDERTVKREMAKLRDRGWLVVKRAAARGRVAVHGLNIEAILRETSGSWSRVGRDFVGRMGGPAPEETAPTNVISFPGAEGLPEIREGQGLWGVVQAQLRADNPTLHAIWFAKLNSESRDDGHILLRAPSRFHASFVTTHHLARIETLLRTADPTIRGVSIEA